MNKQQKSNFFVLATVGILAAATDLRADLVGDFHADLGITANSGDDQAIQEWADQSANPMQNFLRRGNIRIRRPGTPGGQDAVQFELGDNFFEDQGDFALVGATEFSVAVAFHPFLQGESNNPSTTALEVSQLVSAHSNGSDGWALGYDRNSEEVFFSVTDSTGAIATLRVGPGSTMVSRWWTVVAGWRADDGTGNPEFSLALFDSSGNPVGARQSVDPNPSPGDGLFAAPRNASGVHIGEALFSPGDFNFQGRMARLQFYDSPLTEAEEMAKAEEFMISHFVNVLTVTVAGDSGPGTLRDVVEEATLNSRPDLIVFDPALEGVTTNLTSGEIEISFVAQKTRIFGGSITDGNLTPFGPVYAVGAGDVHRIFNVGANVEVEFDNLILFDGFGGGGAILNDGTVTVRNTTFQSNLGDGGGGGAIVNRHQMTLEDCRFLFNRTQDGVSNGSASHGGAILASGDSNLSKFLIARRCTFQLNRCGNGDGAGGGGRGGAIYSSSIPLQLVDCNFLNNHAGNGGDSGAAGAPGGALYANATNSSLDLVKITGCTFQSNTSGSAGLGSGVDGKGGAIVLEDTVGLIENSTFSGNNAFGAKSGAIDLEFGTIRHCTIVDNRGDGAVTNSGPIFVALENSIITDNKTEAGATGIDLAGRFNLTGTSLVVTDTGGPFVGTGTLLAQSGDVAFPAPNGGPTPTMKPKVGSPAINGAIANGNTPATDQRGVARPFGAAPDIGAVEVTPELVVEDSSILESRTVLPFTLILPVAAESDVTITATTSDGTALAGQDFAAKTEDILIPAGTTLVVFRVQIFDDALAEGNETLQAFFTSSDPSVVPILNPTVTGTIVDDVLDDLQPDLPDQPGTTAALNLINATFPLAEVAGTYSGLIHRGVSSLDFYGHVMALKLATNGRFSATFEWQGERFRVKGEVAEIGADFSTQITLKSGKILDINFTVGKTASGGLKMNGSVAENGGPTGFIHAQAGFYNGKTEIAPQAGRYTMLMPVAAGDLGDIAIPQGDSYAAVSVGANGKIKAIGKLGDGTRFSRSSTLTKDGEWAFWNSLYRSKPRRGYVAGTITFRDEVGVSDFDGVIQWEKFADLKEKRYLQGFAVELHAIGSAYVQPPAGTRVLATLADQDYNARLSFSEASLPDGDDAKAVTWDARNRVIHFGPEKIGARVNVKNGLFGGSYRVGSTKFRFAGAAFQKQDIASGQFIFGALTGHALIEPGTGFDYPGETLLGDGRNVSANGGTFVPPGLDIDFDEQSAGKYYGNILSPLGSNDVGYIRSLSVRTNGTFSASFVEAGEQISIKGLFDANGDFSGTVFSKSGREIRVILHTNHRSNLEDFRRISGSISQVGQAAQSILLHRSDFHRKNNPAPRAGNYTMVMPEILAAGFPAGAGYATVNVNTSGRILMRGLLGDRTKFSYTTYLPTEEFFDVYLPLYTKSPQPGSATGRLQFISGNTKFFGSLDWVKNPNPADPFFPAGFFVPNHPVDGVLFTPPAKGERAMDNLVDGFHNCRFVLEENLTNGDVEKIMTWDTRNRLKHYGSAKISVRVNTKTGAVSGRYFENGVKTSFGGVLHQLFGTNADTVKGSHAMKNSPPGVFTIEQW